MSDELIGILILVVAVGFAVIYLAIVPIQKAVVQAKEELSEEAQEVARKQRKLIN